MEFSIQCGVDSLLSHNYTQAFASFEYAARILKDFLTSSTLENVTGIFNSTLPALLYAQFRNAHDVVQVFLKQIGGLATVSRGPMHPLSVLARNLLTLDITPELILGLLQIDLDAQIKNQPHSRDETDIALFTFKCDYLSHDFPVQEAEYTFQHLIKKCANYRFYCQFLTIGMAQVYLQHHKFVEAAGIVSDAPDQFVEWVENGYVAANPRTAPISIMGIILRLTLLAQALAGQGKYEAAEVMFQKSILAGQKYFQPDHPTLIQAQKAKITHLRRLNRNNEAEEIERMVDLGLKLYMLTP